jgi:hypothetical protein
MQKNAVHAPPGLLVCGPPRWSDWNDPGSAEISPLSRSLTNVADASFIKVKCPCKNSRKEVHVLSDSSYREA